MPWQSEVILASQVIIFGENDGLFVYNGSPGLGNPPIFAVSTSASDPFGNQITPNTITDSALPFLLYAPNPGAGNLIASLATAPGTDVYGNQFNQGLQIGPQSQNSWISVVADVGINATYGATNATGLLQALNELWTADNSQVAPGFLGPVLLNAGAANQQVAALLTSPLLASSGMGIMLLAASDDGTLSEGIALCSVTQGPGGVTFTPQTIIAPNSITQFGAGSAPTQTVLTGSGNWMAPANLAGGTVQAECWGGGGGGSGGTSSAGGHGGGGGEYAAEPALAVTAGNSYAYSAGTAGTAGASNGGTGGTGGNTTIAGNSITVTAHGGTGGSASAGGAGGTGSTNTTNNDGGTGGTNSQSGGGSGSQTFTSGSGQWQAPSGVTSVEVVCIGGGGGGGGSYEVTSHGGGSGGGGGGAAVATGVAVTPGTKYNYAVGGGGVGGNINNFPNEDGAAGGDSTITIGATTYRGHGGGGGHPNADQNGVGAGGAGTHTGGNGGSSTSQSSGFFFGGGGGGGGGAGSGGNGGNGGAGNPSTQGGGGSGGAGSSGGIAGNSGGLGGATTVNLNGNGGNQSGGGGGGGGTSNSQNGNGGNGAAGSVHLSWSPLTLNGGGGGGSGGTSSNGNNGGSPGGAAAVSGGGAGGNGGANAAGSAPAAAPGGGGGAGGGNFAGGAGKNGQIRLTYNTTVSAASVTYSVSAQGYPTYLASVDNTSYSFGTASTDVASTPINSTSQITLVTYPVVAGQKYLLRVLLQATQGATQSNQALNISGPATSKVNARALMFNHSATTLLLAFTVNAINTRWGIGSGATAPTAGQQFWWEWVGEITFSASGSLTIGASCTNAANTFTANSGFAELSPV